MVFWYYELRIPPVSLEFLWGGCAVGHEESRGGEETVGDEVEEVLDGWGWTYSMPFTQRLNVQERQ